MDTEPKKIEIYQTEAGDLPYESWFDNLRDGNTQDKVKARIARLRTGNLGKWKPVGEGVMQLVLDFGPGYRVYVGQAGASIILLLCGGDKTTHWTDIATAKQYWADFQSSSMKERVINAKN